MLLEKYINPTGLSDTYPLFLLASPYQLLNCLGSALMSYYHSGFTNDKNIIFFSFLMLCASQVVVITLYIITKHGQIYNIGNLNKSAWSFAWQAFLNLYPSFIRFSPTFTSFYSLNFPSHCLQTLNFSIFLHYLHHLIHIVQDNIFL